MYVSKQILKNIQVTGPNRDWTPVEYNLSKRWRIPPSSFPIRGQYRRRYLSAIPADSSSSRVHIGRTEFRDFTSVKRDRSARSERLSKDTRDRRSIGRATRSPWRVTNPANHGSVIDIEPGGGHRVDTIDSAPGVSPACTIYNVNIPEPGSTLFSRPFPSVSRFILLLCCVLLVRCASRKSRRPIIPCISSPD